MAGALDGKAALVTGAGKNIGRAVALGLARDGAAVVVNGRCGRAVIEAVAGEIVAMGGKAVAHLAEVSDQRAVARMVEDAAAALGGMDIAVSTPGSGAKRRSWTWRSANDGISFRWRSTARS